jgi:predicted nucleic acid-binding protein
MPYLLDIGILLRLVNRGDSLHAVVRTAVRAIRLRGEALLTASQNVAEFWNVWTRPQTARGGLGRTAEDAARCVRILERSIRVVTDSPASYILWKELVANHQVKGVQVHDAPLAALMRTRGIPHLMTLNPGDFRRFTGITAVTPQEVVATTP